MITGFTHSCSGATFKPLLFSSTLTRSSFTALFPSHPKPQTRRRPRCYITAVAEPSVGQSGTSVGQSEIEKAIKEVNGALKRAKEESMKAETERELEKVRVAYLGRKGRVTSVMKLMGKLSKEERPKLGAAVNSVKDELAKLLEVRKEEIITKMFEKQMEEEEIDVTMPGLPLTPGVGGIHPITSTIEKAIDIFIDLGYELIDDPELNREVETDYYCFEALNCPEGHPARAMQDTFYLNERKDLLLRTHTSSVQIRYMEKNKPPFRIIAPGRVYRRDTMDATHSPIFHQVEILAVEKTLNLGKLRATVIHFLKEMLGQDIEIRFRGSYFPFTEPSMEVDVLYKGEWMEVLGCGIVDVDVLKNVNIDPNEYVGFAAGFGVERFAMVMHGIQDIRELYNSDLRFLEQLPKGPFGPPPEGYEMPPEVYGMPLEEYEVPPEVYEMPPEEHKMAAEELGGIAENDGNSPEE